jgi:hypothetical protein
VTTFEWARWYASLGFSVIPVPAPDGTWHNGKVPAIAWKEYQQRRATEEELTRWFQCNPNIAIVTGAISNLVVVDTDSPQAVRSLSRRLPYTPWQVRTSKGFHAFYRHPGQPVRNRASIETGDGKLAMDVRADGGFVIAPPSHHASGAQYTLAGDWNATIDQVPRFWPGWLARLEPVATRPARIGPRPVGDLVERGRAYLAAIPKPEIGQGSDNATLYAACKLVRGFGLSESEATTLLWEWAGGRAGWTHEWIGQKVAHAMRYGTEPIGALR